jgi:hypothetical protein
MNLELSLSIYPILRALEKITYIWQQPQEEIVMMHAMPTGALASKLGCKNVARLL